MGSVTLQNLTKSFANRPQPVVRDTSLAIEDGEFIVLLGPSGCGKTTLLRMIAGLEYPDSGDIRIDGMSVLGREPRNRDIAFVFQHYALYPHLTARQNLDYPLKSTTLSRSERSERVTWAANLAGIGELLGRRPAELSGGEQQRVALARALVRRPRLFLMDEPLSNLDVQTRVRVRSELRVLQQSIRTTTIMVTHDQADAMAAADRIAVVAQGVVQQFGTPDEIYQRPANRFVAEFVGSPAMNLLLATVDRGAATLPGGRRLPIPVAAGFPSSVLLGIRPEAFEFANSAREGGIPGVVHLVEPFGSEVVVHVRAGESTLRVRCGPRVRPAVGSDVIVTLDPGSVHLFHPETGDAIA
jgi:ABC-type sugar transport system ATPase subunit